MSVAGANHIMISKIKNVTCYEHHTKHINTVPKKYPVTCFYIKLYVCSYFWTKLLT